MSNWTALDVGIGLVLVYFILSLLTSSINESIATLWHWRAKYLEQWLASVLIDDKDSLEREKAELEQSIKDTTGAPSSEELRKTLEETQDRLDAVTRFYDGPAISAALKSPSVWLTSWTRKRKPSYVASDIFSAMVTASQGLHDIEKVPATVEEAINNLPSKHLQKIAKSLMDETTKEVSDLRKRLERWFDDSMERVSGWYKRRVQLVMLIIGIGLAVVLNADTAQIVRTLYSDAAIRAAVVAQAGQITENGTLSDLPKTAEEVKGLNSLEIPLGWHLQGKQPTDPQGLPRWRDVPAKVIGLTLTALALMLGAPFWFDALSRLARVRFAGSPPPVSNGKRTGEGDQAREGPNA